MGKYKGKEIRDNVIEAKNIIIVKYMNFIVEI
jgi:hypothetical protein